jgi:hypothetical protein
MYPQLWLSISSPQHTTITLTILSWSIQWSIQPLDANLIYYSWVYRTQNTTQPVTISANQPSNYFVSGDITSLINGTLNPPSLIYSSPTLSLLLGDGIKSIVTEIISTDPINSGEIIYLPVIKFGIDTTPPSLPLLIEWPVWLVAISDILTFNRNQGYDWWSWIEKYTIQLSQNANFPSAIEFITSWTIVQLAGNSLEQKQWFWRLGITDRLWNIIFSNTQSFFYSVWWWIWWSSSSINNQKPSNQTPISDQCDWIDKSGSYFDGICTQISVPPQLVNVPVLHQAPDTRPLRDQIREWIDNKPLNAYIFPAYDAPHAHTIYEYPEELVYEDIYEREDNGGTPVIVYNPRLWIKKSNTVNQHSVAPVAWNGWFNQSYDYLYIWYQSSNWSCAGIFHYCPLEPICLEKKWCQFEELVCTLRE